LAALRRLGDLPAGLLTAAPNDIDDDLLSPNHIHRTRGWPTGESLRSHGYAPKNPSSPHLRTKSPAGWRVDFEPMSQAVRREANADR
jgi:hypothetical protein